MFGSFRSAPACPLEPKARQWIDGRLAWLAGEFGMPRIRSAQVVLPTPEFFPDPFAGHPEEAQPIFERVCHYMGVDPSRVELQFYREQRLAIEGMSSPGTAGQYEQRDGRHLVWIEGGCLDEPLNLIATMAHELGHELLLGQRRITRDEEDHEPLTDLVTVVTGMGVIAANSVIREKHWVQGGYTGWSMGRQGYLSMPSYGYALAWFARQRGEQSPDWARHLRLDVRTAFWQALKYLAWRETEGAREDFEPSGAAAEETSSAEPSHGSDHERSKDAEGEFLFSVESDHFCQFCGASLSQDELAQAASGSPSNHLAICDECRESADENSWELHEDYAAGDKSRSVFAMLFVIGFGAMFVLGVLTMIYEEIKTLLTD